MLVMDETENSGEPAVVPSARRMPAQQRSRERLERILSAASRLIGEKGSDQVKMSEVADLAGISIGSLYQYFPDKSAIIRTLAERHNAQSRRCIEEAFAEVRVLRGLQKAFSDLVDQYYDIFLAEPAMRDIWTGMQADKQLVALELSENRACGALLADAMLRVHPAADPDEIGSIAFLIWQLGEATMRLAISLDRSEGDAILKTFKRMTSRELSEPWPRPSDSLGRRRPKLASR
jgi:AcrR family transcriptional regulator